MSMQDKCMVCARRTISSEIILDAPRWYHSVMRLKWKLISVLSKIVLILMQDSCTVCVEHTIDSKIVLDATNGAPR
jgi:hypothetical protein